MMFGIMLIGFILVCTGAIVKLFLSDMLRWALIITLILGLGLRVYFASNGRLHDWDERYHALVAKNMVEEPFKPMLYKHPVLPYDYKSWDMNHIWLHKQPMTLWIMALSIKIFGNNIWAVRLVSLLMSLILIYIVHLIGKTLFNQKIGLISAYLFAINGFVLEIGSGRASTDHVDLTFLFYISLATLFAILGAAKRSWIYTSLIGMCIGFAILTKWLPALIVLPIWILACLHYKREWPFIFQSSIVILLLAIFIALPWQLYIFDKFSTEAKFESEYNRRHIYEVLSTENSYLWYNIKHLRIKFGDLIYIPLSIFTFFVFRKQLSSIRNKYLLLWIWIFIPLIFFTFVKTKMPGYILFCAPALFIVTSYVWYVFAFKFRRNIYYNLLAFIVLVVLPVRYTIERAKPFELRFLEHYEETYSKNQIIFNDRFYAETMFFTDCYASYPILPTATIIDSLTKSGFEVVVK